MNINFDLPTFVQEFSKKCTKARKEKIFKKPNNNYIYSKEKSNLYFIKW